MSKTGQNISLYIIYYRIYLQGLYIYSVRNKQDELIHTIKHTHTQNQKKKKKSKKEERGKHPLQDLL